LFKGPIHESGRTEHRSVAEVSHLAVKNFGQGDRGLAGRFGDFLPMDARSRRRMMPFVGRVLFTGRVEEDPVAILGAFPIEGSPGILESFPLD
jgi:hypothetical protein